MSKFLILLFVLLSVSISAAREDSFNNYRWNLKNENRGNGKISRRPWFEWWYYKVVVPESNDSFYFAYGVVNPWDVKRTLKGTRAFVGFGDFKSKQQAEQHYPLDKFHASYTETKVIIDDQLATDKEIKGSLKDESGNTYEWDGSEQIGGTSESLTMDPVGDFNQINAKFKKFKITTKTLDLKNAGTDNVVYITLVDKYGKSSQLMTLGNDFNRNSTNTTTLISEVELSQIDQVIIHKRGKNGWKPDSLEVNPVDVNDFDIPEEKISSLFLNSQRQSLMVMIDGICY